MGIYGRKTICAGDWTGTRETGCRKRTIVFDRAITVNIDRARPIVTFAWIVIYRLGDSIDRANGIWLYRWGRLFSCMPVIIPCTQSMHSSEIVTLYKLDESCFSFKGCLKYIFIFISLLTEIHVCKHDRPWSDASAIWLHTVCQYPFTWTLDMKGLITFNGFLWSFVDVHRLTC